ncbi:hypothetical protein KCP73_14910 [Salmonella enterica subsp. enterica]|nr:hypothetical protein KCP73_14910 [Salmonella enterica subsp. enterica]
MVVVWVRKSRSVAVAYVAVSRVVGLLLCTVVCAEIRLHFSQSSDYGRFVWLTLAKVEARRCEPERAESGKHYRP